jgi:hypothetical protein
MESHKTLPQAEHTCEDKAAFFIRTLIPFTKSSHCEFITSHKAPAPNPFTLGEDNISTYKFWGHKNLKTASL